MAEKTFLEEYLNCYVCSEIFRDPVSLSCHSFCSNCLKKFWEQTKNKNCPICERKPSKGADIDFKLKELADVFVERQKAKTSAEKVNVLCEKHPEKEPNLFCEEEQRAVCVCELPHHGHTLLFIEEAVNNLKDQLKPDLDSLQDKRKKYKEVEQKYNEVVQHNKKQVVATEKQIKAEFEKMHTFLREEEKSRLATLREEEEQKEMIVNRELKIIQEQISSLSDSISAVEGELQKPVVSFLSSYKSTQTSARVECKLPEPQLISGALIDVAKQLGNLNFRVWEKMKDKVKFTPVILDPNTANHFLCLSEDLTSVTKTKTKTKTGQQLPDNPERNTRYAAVLGSEGFSSGKYSWEVEVGDHPDWNIGLAKQSVDRKGERAASPRCGTWCLRHKSGEYDNGCGVRALALKRNPQRIQVQLDYDRGEVSFYNPADKTHIYTHKDTFTEKLYPYFDIGLGSNPIQVCQAEMSPSVNV